LSKYRVDGSAQRLRRRCVRGRYKPTFSPLRKVRRLRLNHKTRCNGSAPLW
jgi:hypothetical protein